MGGAAAGIDEVVWVNVPKLPDNAAVLVFVVAAYSGGCLKDVVNGKLHLLEESAKSEVACWDMEKSTGAVDVVGAMFRSSSGWSMRVIDEPAQQGQHFMDILPLIADVIRAFIPSAPKRQKVAFAMEKVGLWTSHRTSDPSPWAWVGTPTAVRWILMYLQYF